MLKRNRLYRCNQCGKTMLRVSGKYWIVCYCGPTGKEGRLTVVNKPRPNGDAR